MQHWFVPIVAVTAAALVGAAASTAAHVTPVPPCSDSATVITDTTRVTCPPGAGLSMEEAGEYLLLVCTCTHEPTREARR